MIFRTFPRFRVGALSLLLCLTATPLFAAQKKHSHKPAPVKQEAPPAPQPPPVPVELTLAQKPAVPPQVSYENRQLTIHAENSTIGDVLRAVRNKTGAVVEFPANATQRIVIDVGPGPAREVLASLLDGSDFNYVILGAAGDAGGIQRVIVTPKQPGGTADVAQTSTPAMNVPPQVYGGVNPQASDNENDADNDSDAENGSEEQAQQPEPTPNRPAEPGVKTPEQLLQELQQQQQQQGQPAPQN